MTDASTWPDENHNGYYHQESFLSPSTFMASVAGDGFFISIGNSGQVFVPTDKAQAMARFLLTGEGRHNYDPDQPDV